MRVCYMPDCLLRWEVKCFSEEWTRLFPVNFFFKKHDIEVGRDSKYLGVQRMEVEACELSAVPTLKYVKR